MEEVTWIGEHSSRPTGNSHQIFASASQQVSHFFAMAFSMVRDSSSVFFKFNVTNYFFLVIWMALMEGNLFENSIWDITFGTWVQRHSVTSPLYIFRTWKGICNVSIFELNDIDSLHLWNFRIGSWVQWHHLFKPY